MPYYNECIFTAHIAATLIFLYAALSLGRSALMAYVAASWLFANFFVIKQITLFGLDVTAADAYSIPALYGLSLLQERYSAGDAQKATWMSCGLLLIAAAFSYLHLSYIPNRADATHDAFSTILATTPRLMAASIISFYIASRLEMRLFQQITAALPRLSFTWRSSMTVLFSTLADTALFTILGLYGLIEAPFHVFCVSLCIKLIAIVSSAPAVRFLDAFSFQRNHSNEIIKRTI